MEVTGDPGVQYSLTVTRSANFDIEPNNTIDHGPDARPAPTASLGALKPGGTSRSARTSTASTSTARTAAACRRIPTRPSAANYVVETVNVQIRMFDKATGDILLDEPLATFFGAFSGGDPYVVYDDIADRWYRLGLRQHRQRPVPEGVERRQPAGRLGTDLRPDQRRRLPRLPEDGLQQGRHLHRLQRLRSRRRGRDDRRDQQGRRPRRNSDLPTSSTPTSSSSGRCRRPRCTATRPAGPNGSSPSRTCGGNTLQVTKLTDYFSSYAEHPHDHVFR